MTDYIEAKYVNITWLDKETALKIVATDEAIEIDRIEENLYELDVINHSQIENGRLGQLAFRYLNESVMTAPYFQLDDGGAVKLLAFKDNVTGYTWWIDGDKWDEEKSEKRWLSRIYSSAGLVRLNIGKVVCHIHISSSTFTYEQLTQYLKDFRNDLWGLILDDASYIKGAGKLTNQGQVDATTLAAFAKFIKHAQAILNKPKVELREIQQLTPRKKVKPVPRTFMELATKGDGNYLTSRASVESLDVAENRYVHYALQRVYLILKVLTSVSTINVDRLGRSINDYQMRLASFSDVKEINEEAVVYDLNEKELYVQRLNTVMQAKVEQVGNENLADSAFTNYQPWTLHFCVDKKAEKLGNNIFFAKVKENNLSEWFSPQNGDYVTVKFNENIPIEVGFEYRVNGQISQNNVPSSCKTRFKYNVLTIKSIEIVGGYKFDSLKNKIAEIKSEIALLKRSNWVRALSRDEKVQQDKEIINIKKVMSFLVTQQANMQEVARALTPKLPVIKKLLAHFKQEKVKVDSLFPNSMTFVQNPKYQGIHTQFKVIKELAGVDDDLLLALQRVDEIPLVNIYVIYERWCLLQIIKVLIHKFNYTAETGWKRKLIEQTLDKGRNIAIKFTNDAVARKVTLWYEKVLPNNNRPDFILDVEAQHYDGSCTLKKRFVMDAKFYQDINKRNGGISTVIDELYREKNYSEDKSSAVFILHPSKNAVPIRRTPQTWANNSYYGEVPMFEWDEELRQKHNHQYGAIRLSPIDQSNYLDELQRLIGMFLQYGMEDNSDSDITSNAAPKAKVFCISCGSSEYSFTQSKYNRAAGWLTCTNCNHFTAYNYCGGANSCGNRLIKNGEYWTYHSTEPLKPLNIKCPQCQNLL
jgi:hypothetical protein